MICLMKQKLSDLMYVYGNAGLLNFVDMLVHGSFNTIEQTSGISLRFLLHFRKGHIVLNVIWLFYMQMYNVVRGRINIVIRLLQTRRGLCISMPSLWLNATVNRGGL